VIFYGESKEVDQQLVRYEVDQLRSCQPIQLKSRAVYQLKNELAEQLISWKMF